MPKNRPELFHNTHNPILPLKYHVPDSEAHVMLLIAKALPYQILQWVRLRIRFSCLAVELTRPIFSDDDGQAYYYWGQLFSMVSG